MHLCDLIYSLLHQMLLPSFGRKSVFSLLFKQYTPKSVRVETISSDKSEDGDINESDESEYEDSEVDELI